MIEVEKNHTIDIYFRGAVGRLHCKYYCNDNKSAPVVLILPPDPEYGGSADSKFVERIADIFVSCGFSVLRLNYRGVGMSEGFLKERDNAVYDACIALDWLQQQHKEATNFWVCGYSFGAWVASNIMIRRPEIESFVLVSPIVNEQYDYGFMCPCLCSGMITIGDKDEFTNFDDINKLVAKMNESQASITKLAPISGAGHLFKGLEEKVCEEIKNYVNITLATRIAKPIRKKRRRRKKKDSIFNY